MERVEDVTTPIDQEDLDTTPAAARAVDPWLLVPLVLDVVLIAGLVWTFSSLDRKLDATQASLRSQQLAAEERAGGLEAQVRALEGQNVELKSELEALNSYVASESEEDVLFLKIVITKKSIDRKLARDIARHVRHYATLYEQDPDLVLAIIAVESRFDPEIVSHMGATGLMQVMPQWTKILGITEPLTDPETSIRYGMQILGFYKNMYKDIEMALTAYNRGPGPVDMALMRGQSPLNKYAPRVLKTYEELKSLRVGQGA